MRTVLRRGVGLWVGSVVMLMMLMMLSAVAEGREPMEVVGEVGVSAGGLPGRMGAVELEGWGWAPRGAVGVRVGAWELGLRGGYYRGGGEEEACALDDEECSYRLGQSGLTGGYFVDGQLWRRGRWALGVRLNGGGTRWRQWDELGNVQAGWAEQEIEVVYQAVALDGLLWWEGPGLRFGASVGVMGQGRIDVPVETEVVGVQVWPVGSIGVERPVEFGGVVVTPVVRGEMLVVPGGWENRWSRWGSMYAGIKAFF